MRAANIHVYVVIVVTALGTSPASADRKHDYDVCYQKIERELGPRTDINWMQKVWDCAKERGVASLKERYPNAPPSQGVDGTAGGKSCNFERKIDECQGTVTIADASSRSEAVEITITSSAGACSKVVYRLYNTTQTAIIHSGVSAREKLFLSRPINQQDIVVTECGQYEGGAVPAKSNDDLIRYGFCLGNRTWMKKLDEEYSSSSAVIGNDAFGIAEYLEWFSNDKTDKIWIRRHKLVQKCL